MTWLELRHWMQVNSFGLGFLLLAAAWLTVWGFVWLPALSSSHTKPAVIPRTDVKPCADCLQGSDVINLCSQLTPLPGGPSTDSPVVTLGESTAGQVWFQMPPSTVPTVCFSRVWKHL